MRFFKLAYTENKTDVVAPPQCLLVLDLWVLKGYLFVLYIKSPVYFEWLEKLNSERMVKLLNEYEEEARLNEDKRKKLAEIQKEVEKQTDKLITKQIIKEKKDGAYWKKFKNSRKGSRRG